MKSMNLWQPIETAPKDGTRFIGQGMGEFGERYLVTWYGKVSHVSLYGWCHGIDVEDIDLWQPTRWHPIETITNV